MKNCLLIRFVLMIHHFNHYLWTRLSLKTIPRMNSQLMRMISGLEIHPGAIVYKNVIFINGVGTVIGETAIIKNGCVIYEDVTLGNNGSGVYLSKRHPTLEENVLIYPGVKVLGNITIGAYSIINANCVVTKNIPVNSYCEGIPLKIRKEEEKC